MGRSKLALGLIFIGGLSSFGQSTASGSTIAICNFVDLAVVATVVKRESELVTVASGETIKTQVHLDVSHTLIGTSSTPLVLEIEGGEVGSTGLVSSAYPKMQLGSRYALFLSRHGNGRFPSLAGYRYLDPTKAEPSATELLGWWNSRCLWLEIPVPSGRPD
jgi:hypothetical protein